MPSSIREFDLNAFSVRFGSESDRACAVLGAAVLDAKLEDLFRRTLRCFHERLLKNTCPLGTFSARILVARALEWINEDAQIDLDTVRGIRNDFAHSFDHNLSFEDKSVSGRCKNLRTAQAFLDAHDLAVKVPSRKFSSHVIYAMRAVFEPARWRYQLTVEFLVQYLDEISGDTSGYSGPDFMEEIRAITMRQCGVG